VWYLRYNGQCSCQRFPEQVQPEDWGKGFPGQKTDPLSTGATVLHPARKTRAAQPDSILNGRHRLFDLFFITEFRAATVKGASFFDKPAVVGVIVSTVGNLGERSSPLDQSAYPKA